LFTESNPIPLKAALALLNLATGEVRLPLIRATEATKDRLADILAHVMSREEWTASHRRYALAS
jgi:4-hydroxy-tetrahydrodipicolinate synthase